MGLKCVGEVLYGNYLSGNTSKGLTVREKYSMYKWVYTKTSSYSRSSNKCALKCRDLKRVWEEP